MEGPMPMLPPEGFDLSRTNTSAAGCSSAGRFEVKLQYGSTTYVSYKQLVQAQDADRRQVQAAAEPAAAPEAEEQKGEEGGGKDAPGFPDGLSRLISRDPADGSGQPPQKNRFGSVIEKIERLYMGLENEEPVGGEEDVDKLDEESDYDKDDPFIDDSALDDFYTKGGKAKRSGFFVNKGDVEKEEVVQHAPKLEKRPKDSRHKELKMAKKITGITKELLIKKRKAKKAHREKEALSRRVGEM